MSSSPASPAVADATRRGPVIAWSLWDWGSAAFNAVIVTFVFSVYLTDSVGDDLSGPVSASSWLGWSVGAASLVIAVLAPVMGQRSDASGHRKRSLALLTLSVVVPDSEGITTSERGPRWRDPEIGSSAATSLNTGKRECR